MVCLAFIMVNVGYEFVLDKSHMGQYGKDFLIAMAAAALPAALVALWFIFALPDPAPWDLALLAGLFAAPTSAGILFSMLEAAGLKETWLFGKARVLAVFDDLGTLLLLIPLKILVSGFKWELMIEVGLVVLMLAVGYWKLHAIPLPSSWRWTALYALLVTASCKLVHYVTDEHIAMEAIEMEVLLPAFTLGCLVRLAHGGGGAHRATEGDVEMSSTGGEAGTQTHGHGSAFEERVKTCMSMVFMLLVGLSMPSLFGGDGHHGDPSPHHEDASKEVHENYAAQHHDGSLSADQTILHTFVVSVLMVAGKMLPTACYRREVDLRTRFALSLGMCPRGEVGAGVIVISLNLGMQGASVTVAVLSLAVNLMLSSVFIMMVKRLLCQPMASKTAGGLTEEASSTSTMAATAKEEALSQEMSNGRGGEEEEAGEVENSSNQGWNATHDKTADIQKATGKDHKTNCEAAGDFPVLGIASI